VLFDTPTIAELADYFIRSLRADERHDSEEAGA
jgi:hypothetical protein